MKIRILVNFLLGMVVIAGGLIACQTAPGAVATTSSIESPPAAVTQEVAATAISVPTQIIAPTPDEQSLRSTIISALMALNTKQNKMENVTEIEGGKVNHSLIEFIPSDKKHIVSIEDEVEYIIISDDVYMKVGSSGAWEAAEIAASLFMGQGDVTEQTIGEMIRQVQFVRKDQLDGKTVNVVKYVEISKTENGEIESQVELWIGEANGLPYKMIKDGKIYAVVNDPQTGENKQEYVNAITTTVFDFGATFQIEAPMIK